MPAKLVKTENKIDSAADSKKEFEKSVRPFIEKSLSIETRRAYGRVIKEFFTFGVEGGKEQCDTKSRK